MNVWESQGTSVTCKYFKNTWLGNAMNVYTLTEYLG